MDRRIDHVFKESPWFHWIGHILYVRYVRVWMEEARYSKCEAHQYPGSSTASRDGASSAGKNRTTLVQTQPAGAAQHGGNMIRDASRY